MSSCPLITPYTDSIGLPPILLERLYTLRQYDYDSGDEVSFNRPSKLRTHIFDTERKEVMLDVPFVLREYQKVMTHHLARMPRFVCGDAVGLGKTIDAISACTWLYDRLPRTKVIVLTTKSTTHQWADEFERFSTLRPYIMGDKYQGKKSYEGRYLQLENFLKGEKRDVMVCKYSSMIGKRRKLKVQFDEDGVPLPQGVERVSQEIRKFSETLAPYGQEVILILDEAHKFKSLGASIRNLVKSLQKHCRIVWALTATAIKNGLEEFYAICTAIGIKPFGSMVDFYKNFCILEKRHKGKGRHEEDLVGYVNVKEFKQGVRPFFLGRSQAQVREPMPRLTTKYHPIDLDNDQAKLLLEDIPNGDFILPPSAIKVAGEIIYKERDINNTMTMMSVYQLVANSPALLDRNDLKKFLTTDLSPKEEGLMDLLDGEYRGEKVIVFTKYRSWIDRYEWLTKQGHFTKRKFLRITGAESEEKREHSKKLFQNPKSGYDVIFINTAGIEGINLQQAAHLIALDVPWSWGDLIQLVGRMVRMASPHSACMLHIFAAKGTIDEYGIETLKGKKGVFEKILGESHSAGILDDRDFLDLDSGMEQAGTDEEFASLMRAHCKNLSMSSYLSGQQLTAAQTEADYTMVFLETEPKSRKRKRIESIGRNW